MATVLPPVPNPPPPNVQRFDKNGKPTTALVTYEQDLQTFLKAVKAKLDTL